MVAGVYPANKEAGLDPVEALRSGMHSSSVLRKIVKWNTDYTDTHGSVKIRPIIKEGHAKHALYRVN